MTDRAPCHLCRRPLVTTVSAGHREIGLCLSCLRLIGDDAAARVRHGPRIDPAVAWRAAIDAALAAWAR